MSALILDMPVDAENAEPLGRLDAVVYDPTTGCVSYLIVASDDGSRATHLIHSSLIQYHDTRLRLNITRYTLSLSAVTEPGTPADGTDPPRRLPPTTAISRLRTRHAVHEELGHSDVTIRRSTAVVDADGEPVGRVHGVAIASPAQHLTDVLVAQAHTPVDHVVVPASALAHVGDDQLTLSIGRDAVEELALGGA